MGTKEKVLIDGIEYVPKAPIIEKEDLKEERKKYVLFDSTNVLAMGKIQNYLDEDKPLTLLMNFIRKNSDLKIYWDMRGKETFEIWKGKEKWGRYSKDYYDIALRVATAWNIGKLDFYIQEEKNTPVLLACNDLGFVLAPRIESDDETN